ncbi:MAG: hypothetical protein JWP97_4048, partial [Labilithrix sp.]|nr:hypothetical protein [Labilithrix sp.]
GAGGSGGISAAIAYKGSPPGVDGATKLTFGAKGAKGTGGVPGVNDGADGIATAIMLLP